MTAETKRTPSQGPWSYKVGAWAGKELEIIENIHLLDGNGNIFGILDGADSWCEDDTERTNEEVEANARLIAAAPDLLEALRLTMTTAAQLGATDMELDAARAAIAKAEGRDNG